jgi:phosphoglycerate kinase
MAPVAERLRELTETPVRLAPEVVGARARALSEELDPDELLLLENVRFEPGETRNDPRLARALAELGDVYVNDAFGASHRAHASTEGVAHLLPSAAGRLLEREVRALGALLEHPPRPLVAVIGGAKVTDKIGVIERFTDLADTVIIGGAMCFPFLAAQGHAVGDSLCEPEDVQAARRALAYAQREAGAPIELPSDLVLGDRLAADAERRELDGVDVPEGWMGLDIGPHTARRYAERIAAAGAVFWNGPMGAFELEPFAQGTREVADAVARAPGVTVVGGGDSAAALRRFGLQDAVDHLSTGGGASLAFIEGEPLPGVQALDGASVPS